jgi:hypothetical protein
MTDPNSFCSQKNRSLISGWNHTEQSRPDKTVRNSTSHVLAENFEELNEAAHTGRTSQDASET